MAERTDREPDEVEPVWRPPSMPDEHTRMGLTRNTVEGAWIEFAASLDPRRPLHVAVAWVLLAFFVAPLVLSVMQLLR